LRIGTPQMVKGVRAGNTQSLHGLKTCIGGRVVVHVVSIPRVGIEYK
jgi:hypothetical protein